MMGLLDQLIYLGYTLYPETGLFLVCMDIFRGHNGL